MVRSKSEVIIANMLFDREVPFLYERPLYAPDGSFYLPDFTITWRGEQFFWEHLGLLYSDEYRRRRTSVLVVAVYDLRPPRTETPA